jgi:ribonuclease E
MSKELFVSSTPHETKVAVVEEDLLTEIYYERENEYTLAGSIYKGRVTRVLPGMQSAFVNIGLERDAFLYVSDFLLEEEDDTDGLEQVVSRSRPVITDPQAGTDENRGPIEAQDAFPAPSLSDDVSGEESSADAQDEASGEEGQNREGARKWRGRRRRRGRGGRYDREDQRTATAPHQENRADSTTDHPELRPEPVQESRHESRPESRHDPRGDVQRQDTPRHDRHDREPRRDNRYSNRNEPEADLEPIVLPGESISKYQPPSAHPAAEVKQSAPVRTSRPSTEFSIDPSQFTAGSMTLPGESISKYKGDEPHASANVASEAVAQHHAPTHEHEHGFLQDAASAGPVPHQAAAGSHHEQSVAVAPVPEVLSPTHDDDNVEGDRQAKHEAERFAPMKVTPVFTGDEAEEEIEEVEFDEAEVGEAPSEVTPHSSEQHHPSEQHHQPAASAEAAAVAKASPATTSEAAPEVDSAITNAPLSIPAENETPAEQPWKASGRGVVEEEVIEEEESDLPAYEDDLDLGEFEELEEENLVPMGRELTEAVRDAHINEHATGQYEAEGLEENGDDSEDADDDFDEEEGHPATRMLSDAGDGEVEEFEAGGQSEEDADGARAEHRTGGHQRSDRRPNDRDRRGGGQRRPGRRVRGRRPHTPQRQLPAISDLLKEGQEILVQIAKEPIAKKGARITSHIALPGRYLVFMPTVHHTGVSRKIASEEERHRLKRIVTSERGDSTGGFIVRTAAAGANEDDLRADIRFLINLWTEIKGRAESSKAPALIYHDLNLVERILRDQVTTSFSSIWADTEQEYERILRFVSRFQPSLVRRVKLYSKETPLFEQFNITDEVNKALKSKVWLKSGGYIVINQTEALVAIDINTGKYVGKTARLEDTIVKTNLDAIREIVRQIRLRDLGGIIVIDFIDMDERKNRQKVMQALEEALKSDRAPSKVLQFNDFGLVAITRKRVKQSLERTLGQPCPTCQATGMIKSVTTVCNEIYVEMRKMSRHFERDVMLRVSPEVAKSLKASGGKWVQEMEDLTKRTILVKSDPLLHPEQFDIQ